MNHKLYERMIKMKLAWINVRLGTNYKTSYTSVYGGWNMYLEHENGGIEHGKLGFLWMRKSSAEMLAYLDGMINGISAKWEEK